MALPSDYARQTCSLARTLEIIGERWTLLIVRDAFYGVRRFGDFADHLRIPRAVLAERLKSLVAADVLSRVPGEGRHEGYELTSKGVSLWPTVRSLIVWGDEHYAPEGPRRLFQHAADGGPLDPTGRCEQCDRVVDVRETLIVPGPGMGSDEDPVSSALRQPHQLLEPLQRKPQPANSAGSR